MTLQAKRTSFECSPGATAETAGDINAKAIELNTVVKEILPKETQLRSDITEVIIASNRLMFREFDSETCWDMAPEARQLAIDFYQLNDTMIKISDLRDELQYDKGSLSKEEAVDLFAFSLVSEKFEEIAMDFSQIQY